MDDVQHHTLYDFVTDLHLIMFTIVWIMENVGVWWVSEMERQIEEIIKQLGFTVSAIDLVHACLLISIVCSYNMLILSLLSHLACPVLQRHVA